MRKKHLLGLAVAGAAAVAWFCFREDESNLERTWRWAEGNSSYDFELELHQRAEFWGRDQQGIGLDLAAKGILNLTSSGCPRFPCELAVELEALNLEEFELLGARLAENPEGEPIGGLLLVERDGRVDGIRPGEGTTKVGEALLHLLAAELSWPEAEEPTWRERLTSLIGTAEVEFVRGRDEIQRKTLGFSELNLPSGGEGLQLTVCGSARAQFGADHIFASITAEDSVYGRDSDQRQVVSVDKRFVFERRAAATRRVSVGALSVDARPLGQIPFDEEGARAELLRQRLDGFGLEQLREGLRAYRAGGEVADHAQWLWKAVALLRHDDSACRELEQEFAAAGGAVRYRALLVDLLVGAGSTQAQESLRMMLGTKEARSSPTFGNLVQRLAHLNRPDAHTLEFVRDAYTDDGVDQMSAAAALGGVAGNVYRSGGRAEALSATAALIERLDHTSDEREEAALLIAIGNAGLLDHAATIIPFADSESPRVRAQTAMALRKLDTAEARQTRLELAADSDPNVRRSALRALQDTRLSSAELTNLLGHVDLLADEQVVGALLNFLAPYRGDPAQRDILRALAAVPFRDGRISARISAMLAGG